MSAYYPMEELNRPIDLDKLPKPYLPANPDWQELYDFTWRLAARNVRQINGRRYMDCAWDLSRNYQWVWDTCFTVLFGRYGNGQFPAITSLDTFYEFQQDDGFIAMTYDLDNGSKVFGDRLNPPLFAWVEWEYYMTTGDASRFRRVIPRIEKLMHWIDCNRRPDQRQCLRLPPEPQTGTAISVPTEELKIEDAPASCFYFYQDCGSSGMDDSPRTPRHPAAGRFYDWIDLSCQMVLSGRMLSRMHQVENNLAAARQWQDRAEKLTREINRELWCDKTGFYHDRMLGANFVPSKTAAGFWAILAGVCDLKQQQILEEHLQNPATFGRPVPVPSLSADDLNYCPDGTYWLGGVWAPTNYMIIRGLMRSGSGDLAHQLARKYLDALAEVYNKYQPHSLWECYCSETPLPGRRPYCRREFVKPDFVGWTGIGPVSMLIENILGIDLQAPARHINWDLRLPGDHGLDNLYVQGEPVSLRCQVGNGKPTITVKARTDLTLQVRHQDKTTKLQVRPGPEQCWDLN